MKPYQLPKELEEILCGQPYTRDHTGLSGSDILLFEDKVLKCRPESRETEAEYAMMCWLDGKLPVPHCLYHEVENGIDFLLMTKVPGTMSCDDRWLQDPERLVSALAEALKRLWKVEISHCPVDWRLDQKLAAAGEAVAKGAVDVEDSEPGTFGAGGFRDPEELLCWLREHRPEEDPVLSHGDFCLPNIFLKDGALSGVIDLGRTGVADRWQDIALCYRSLIHNFDGTYSGKAREGFDPGSLFRALGIEPDWEKLRYYILLDELF